jgi:hypothetical protein
MSRTASTPNLKRALAAALFCLCSAALAAPEKSSSAPAGRLYSVAEFNRLGAGVYWVEAYIAALDHPRCEPGGGWCPAIRALISDVPGERVCVDEKACVLTNTLPTGQKIYRVQYTKAAPGKTDSGEAFRVLDNLPAGLKLSYSYGYNVKIRLRIRVQNDPGKSAILEDFCAGADCEKRLYTLGEFNRLGTAGIYRVEAYLVAWMYPQCKPGGECYPVLALASDAPRGSCENGKIGAVVNAFYSGSLEVALNELNQACPGQTFRLLDVPFVPVGKKLAQEPENRRNGRLRLYIRIREQDSSNGFPPGGFAILEDFCVGVDCEKQQGKGN